jgi:hypothetical protein
LLLIKNNLQLGKSQKTGKTRKKVQNNFPNTPDFLQKGAEFEGRNLQVADFQPLAIWKKKVTRGFHCTCVEEVVERRREGRRETRRPATGTVAVPKHWVILDLIPFMLGCFDVCVQTHIVRSRFSM